MIFGTMKTNIGNRVGTTASDDLTIIGQFLNRTIRQFVDDLTIQNMKQGRILTEDDRFSYPLNADVSQLLNPMVIPQSQQFVHQMGMSEFNFRYPNPVADGAPYLYVDLGQSGVERQPHTKLRIISDSVSDTQSIKITGISDHREITENVTLTGLTAVLTTNSYSMTTALPLLSSVAVGTVTVTANSSSGNSALPTVAAAGSVTICTITAGLTEPTALLQPGSLIRIKSTAEEADTLGVIIEGSVIDTTNILSDIPRRVTLTTTATATTENQTSLRFTSISQISKTEASTGNILIMADPGARIIAVIPPEVPSVSYTLVGLYPIGSGESINYTYERAFADLANSGDTINLPTVTHHYVEKWAEYAYMDHIGQRKGIQHIFASQEYQEDLQRVRRRLNTTGTSRVVMGGRVAGLTSGANRVPSDIALPING